MFLDSDTKIIDLFGMVKQEGDIGLEIEMEADDGPYFPALSLPTGWTATSDGSLRGVSVEYVLKQPVKVKTIKSRLDNLQKCIQKVGVKTKYSFRAGVHVHINCQQMTTKQVAIFAALYYSLENVLIEWCGPDRIGNHFCLRAIDAEAVLSYAGKFLSTGKTAYIQSNDIRYAALNWLALSKYGSMEFRSLATDPTFDRIQTWVDLLYHLKELSLTFDSIPTLLEHFSMVEPRDWLKECLGDFYKEVQHQNDIDNKVWSGIYSAQDLLFVAMVGE